MGLSLGTRHQPLDDCKDQSIVTRKKKVQFNPIVEICRFEKGDELDHDRWHCYSGLLSCDRSSIGNRRRRRRRNLKFFDNTLMLPVSNLTWSDLIESEKTQQNKDSNAYQETALRLDTKHVNPSMDNLWQWSLLKTVERTMTGAL
ncbi:hypothetical protein SLA2020_289690 [Shorea laevis]